VDVPGVTVDGDRVVHERPGAGRRGVRSQWSGPLAALVDEGRVGKASRCWGEGEHATLRSTTSTSRCADEDRIRRTHRTDQGRCPDGGLFDPLRSDETRRRPRRRPQDLPLPQYEERPMCGSVHRAGPRVGMCGLGRVCNKVYRNDWL
jgi:hypothetical protein